MQWNSGTLSQRKIRNLFRYKERGLLYIYISYHNHSKTHRNFISHKQEHQEMSTSCHASLQSCSHLWRVSHWPLRERESWRRCKFVLMEFGSCFYDKIYTLLVHRSHPVLIYTLLTKLLRELYKSSECLLLRVRSRLEHMG